MRIKALIFSFILLYACTHDPIIVGNGNGDKLGECDPDTAYFANDILPLLISSCAIPGCHDAATAEDGIVLDSYENIMNSDEEDLIVRGDPDESELIEVLTEDDPEDIMPPAPYDPLSQNEINMLKTWIRQQALNNGCEADCDTSLVGFASSIKPMIDQFCVGCHGTAQPQAGISLTNYQEISEQAANGALLGTVQGNSPYFAPMPPGANELSDCQIQTLEIWIQDGYPNN